MPAQRIEGTTAPIRRCDVAGLDASTSPEFVGHVGLAGEDRDRFRETDLLELLHMIPPLERGGGMYPVHCIGTAGLTADEMQQINVFMDELELEYRAASIRDKDQYIVAPHACYKRADDDTVIYRKFSCAGFVIESYREAGIELVNTEPGSLPPVSLDTLVRQYPERVSLLQRHKFREQLGIGTPVDGPWPVVLAGYVVNALNRSEEEIRNRPHIARPGDEFFPSRCS